MNITIKNKSLLFALLALTFSHNAFSQLIKFDIQDFSAASETIERTYSTQWGDLLLSVQRSSSSAYLVEYTNSQGDFGLIKRATLNLSFDTSGLINAGVENVKMTFGHVDHNYNYFIFTNQNPDIIDNQGLIYYDNAAAHPFSSEYPDASRLGGFQCGGTCVAPSVLWENLLDNNELSVFAHGTVAFGNITFDVNESLPPSVSVPEPMSLLLLGFGFAALGFSKKRKSV